MTRPPQVIRQVLEHCLQHRLTFAAYRKPGASWRVMVQQDPYPKKADLDQLPSDPHFLVIPFRNDRSPSFAIKPDLLIEQDDCFPAALNACMGCRPMDIRPPYQADPQAHIASILKALQRIDAGVLSKVVLARAVVENMSLLSLHSIVELAAAAYPNAFVHVHHTPEHGLWLGASPERLLEVDVGMVHVDSIAGTRRAGDPAWTTKEKGEQRMVTDHILECFNDLGINSIRVEGPKDLEAGPVMHLHTQVGAPFDPMNIGEVIHRLHPTPAVAGTPPDQALYCIDELEGLDRGLYAGVVGPIDLERGQASLYVNIRCAQVFSERITLFVGGGITAGSDPKEEWTETERKASTWRDLIQQFARPPVRPVA